MSAPMEASQASASLLAQDLYSDSTQRRNNIQPSGNGDDGSRLVSEDARECFDKIVNPDNVRSSDDAVLRPFRREFRRSARPVASVANNPNPPVEDVSAASSHQRSGSDEEATSGSASDSQDTLFAGLIKRPKPAYRPERRYGMPITSDIVFGGRSDFNDRLRRTVEYARERSKSMSRPKWLQWLFQGAIYVLLLGFIYFVLVGWPLWQGVVYKFWFVYKNELNLAAGWAIFLGISLVYAVAPLFVLFEGDPETNEKEAANNSRRAADTAIIIPCYRSENVIGPTLTAAIKTFPPENIFVVANGNSETPLDNTADVCRRYGVHHIWVPIGSKVTAQFAGVNAAYRFQYVMMMDDDCCIPVPFPVATYRLQRGRGRGQTKCIGYTLHSVGTEGLPGSLCQQAQDLEYKMSGLQRYFWGLWGSAPFAHGAISLWERDFLLECFGHHPGFQISEDWYFGLVSRKLGGRIQMCSQIFVPTETPNNLLLPSKGVRAGYGELTVTKQRMMRWNFFLVSRTWYNIKYILFSWHLGKYEVATKLEVFREMYETLLLLSTPLILPISIGVNPEFTIGITCAIIVMYALLVIIFNEVHLRKKGIAVSRKTAILYYPLYKTYLRIINVISCYVSIFRYAKYFRRRHPGIMENKRTMETMLALSEAHFGQDNIEIPPNEAVQEKADPQATA